MDTPILLDSLQMTGVDEHAVRNLDGECQGAMRLHLYQRLMPDTTFLTTRICTFDPILSCEVWSWHPVPDDSDPVSWCKEHYKGDDLLEVYPIPEVMPACRYHSDWQEKVFSSRP